MVLRLKTKKENSNNRIFLSREWPWVAIICALVTYGNLYQSKMVLLAAAAVIAVTILRSSAANAFYWALFLVPNIRMLDLVGVKYLVNIIMAVPLITYFLRYGTWRISLVALLGSFLLFVMELVHDVALNNMSNLINIGGWVLNFMLCIVVTVDSRVKLSKDDVFSALSTGVIISAVMYLISSGQTVLGIVETLEKNTRLEAFANDPNAYSMYAILAIACVINVRGRKAYRFITLALLVGLGLLTASKMGLITIVTELALIFLQIFIQNKENKELRKFAWWTLAGVTGLAIVLWDYVGIVIRNFIRRAGTDDLQNIDMGEFTTGRWDILLDYLNILGQNPMCLLFGYGFGYRLHLGQARWAVAHNTYMDLFLTWGVVGTVIFLFILYLWIRDYVWARGIQKIRFIQYIPLITLLITFMALSCLSASMFPFVLAVAFIQWLPGEETKVQMTDRSAENET